MKPFEPIRVPRGIALVATLSGLICFFAAPLAQADEASHQSFYPDGKLRSQGSLKDESMQGHWTRYYENGQVRDEGDWDSGKPHGLWRANYENGRHQWEGWLDQGQRVCAWKEWSESGQETLVSYPPSPICETSRVSRMSFKWNVAALSFLSVWESSGGAAYSVRPEWCPRLRISDRGSVEGSLGATILRSADSRFASASAVLWGDFELNRLGFALGAGTQYLALTTLGLLPELAARVRFNHLFAKYEAAPAGAGTWLQELSVGWEIEL